MIAVVADAMASTAAPPTIIALTIDFDGVAFGGTAEWRFFVLLLMRGDFLADISVPSVNKSGFLPRRTSVPAGGGTLLSPVGKVRDDPESAN